MLDIMNQVNLELQKQGSIVDNQGARGFVGGKKKSKSKSSKTLKKKKGKNKKKKKKGKTLKKKSK